MQLCNSNLRNEWRHTARDAIYENLVYCCRNTHASMAAFKVAVLISTPSCFICRSNARASCHILALAHALIVALYAYVFG